MAGRDKNSFTGSSGRQIKKSNINSKKGFFGDESSNLTLMKISGLIAVVAVLVLVIILPVYFLVLDVESTTETPSDTTTIIPTTVDSTTTPSAPSGEVSDFQKFDCLPEKDVTQEKCEQRGCSWSPSNTDLQAPNCFFYGPRLYIMEGVTSVTDESLTSILKPRDPNILDHYGEHFTRLTVKTIYISRTTLRVKISPDQKRFEVPMDHKPGMTKPRNALYTVEHSNEETFGVKVTRRSTTTPLFDTSVGELMFSDQFLQISTKIASEHIYGFGEHMHENFKHNFQQWKTYGMFTTNRPVEPDVSLYGVHPYFMCMEGDGNAYGVFFANSNSMDVSIQPTPAVTYRSVGGLIDFYIFLGPSPEEVTQQYTEVIGRPYLPPYWSLGFHLSKYGYGDLTNLTKVVDRNLAAGIPYDVQYSDIDYMERKLDFTVHSKNYAGLGDYVRSLKEKQHMRYVIILDPAISGNETASYVPFTEGVWMNIFIKTRDGEIAWGKAWPDLPGVKVNSSRGPGYQIEHYRAYTAFPDFFCPNTSEWWGDLIIDFRETIEFDGLWIDMNEPASFVDGSPSGCPESTLENPPYTPAGIADENLHARTLCMQNIQCGTHSGEGTVHYNVHSLYGWSQTIPTLDACRAATGERCMVISRSTYPGSGKYAGHWLGDNSSKWSHLAASITGMLEFNLFGIPFVGANVCGFLEDTTPELCQRWMQLGAFYPYYRNHNDKDAVDQDPGYFGEEFINAITPAMQTRYMLLPYLYSLFYEAHTTGSTVVRAVMNQFPMDNMTYELDRQFMWGSSLLITPTVEEGATAVEGYFPQARWFDFYSGREMQDNGFVKLDAPPNHINLHLLGGGIVPTQVPATTTYYSRNNDFGIIVALDDLGEAGGKLFWDDGSSIDTIGKMQYNLFEFSCASNLLKSKVIHCNNAHGNMTLAEVRVLGVRDTITRVTVDGRNVSFAYNDDTKKLIISNLNLDLLNQFEIRWEINNEWRRIDCMPSFIERPDRISCRQLGCVWEQANAASSIPSCFYPFDDQDMSQVPIYTASLSASSQERKIYSLSLNSAVQRYGVPVKNLQLKIEYQTDNRLHFKISDPVNVLYEIPKEVMNLTSEMSSNEKDAAFEVEVANEPFNLQIKRKLTGKTIFDTSIGPIVFEDRFLQLTTALPSEHVFGFGEHSHRRYKHDINWKRWGIFARDSPPFGDWNFYGHQTFYMAIDDTESGSAVGVYLHNSNAMDVSLQPTPALTYRMTGGVLDFYIFLGNTQEEVVQHYHNLIGRPTMPPYWALGFHLSRWGYGSLDRVRTVVQEMRDAEIPFDVQYGDIDYMDEKKDFTYDHVNFADLPSFVNELHDFGMKYVIILDPAIKIEDGYEPYEEGIKRNVFIMDGNGTSPVISRVWPGNTHHPDFTHPNASEWWLGQCLDFYHNKGIKYDALWVDMNEPSNFQNYLPGDIANHGCLDEFNKPPFMPRILWFRTGLHDRTLCMESKQFLGRHYDLHSLYGHTMSLATMRVLDELKPDERSFVLTRSTFAGTGKYAGHWLGDNQSTWSAMAWSIAGMIEFNLFGIPYVGADICGFMLDATAELCQRWMQIGAFYPFSRNHNGQGNTPQHPTAFGSEVTASSKKILEIRYSMLPYWYTLFHKSNEKGGTVIRALVHEFPSDVNAWDADNQFLVGSGFLVTAVLEEGARKVTGYFPVGSRWFDFHTGEELLRSGDFVSLDAPLDHINLHVRGGTIIPMQAPATTTVKSRMNPFYLLVALDDSEYAFGELYWDDGESRAIGDKYIAVHFTCSPVMLDFALHHAPVELDVSKLYLENVTVLGLKRDEIKEVTLYEGGATSGTPTFFSYENNRLEMTGFRLRLDQENRIEWS